MQKSQANLHTEYLIEYTFLNFPFPDPFPQGAMWKFIGRVYFFKFFSNFNFSYIHLIFGMG